MECLWYQSKLWLFVWKDGLLDDWYCGGPGLLISSNFKQCFHLIEFTLQPGSTTLLQPVSKWVACQQQLQILFALEEDTNMQHFKTVEVAPKFLVDLRTTVELLTALVEFQTAFVLAKLKAKLGL